MAGDQPACFIVNQGGDIVTQRNVSGLVFCQQQGCIPAMDFGGAANHNPVFRTVMMHLGQFGDRPQLNHSAPKFFRIFFASGSLISLWCGIASTTPFCGFTHKE
jgi:hypothetical protein